MLLYQMFKNNVQNKWDMPVIVFYVEGTGRRYFVANVKTLMKEWKHDNNNEIYVI